MLGVLPRCVPANLPVHCLLQDVAGEWEFHVGPLLPAEYTDAPARIPHCGHHVPNNVLSMLALDKASEVPDATAELVHVNLTEDVEQLPLRHLRANIGTARKPGAWTMVFDEGFEVRVDDGRSFSAQFSFDALQDSGRSPVNGERWDTIARYYGRRSEEGRLKPKGDLYACRYDRTSVGWWYRKNARGEHPESGCFWVVRKEK